jgi:GMP synthase (glutamine-hydrolysing)
LAGVTDPELKRKAIGNAFIEVLMLNLNLLRCNLVSTRNNISRCNRIGFCKGPSATIKSHHNVGVVRLYEIKIVEPLRMLLKMKCVE